MPAEAARLKTSAQRESPADAARSIRTYHAPNARAASPARASARRPSSSRDAPLAAAAAAAAHATPTSWRGPTGWPRRAPTASGRTREPAPATPSRSPCCRRPCRDTGRRGRPCRRHPPPSRWRSHRPRHRRPDDGQGHEQRDETDAVCAGDGQQRPGAPSCRCTGEIAATEGERAEEAGDDAGRQHGRRDCSAWARAVSATVRNAGIIALGRLGAPIPDRRRPEIAECVRCLDTAAGPHG